jgi:CHAT domain-containing protein/uncharacterized iron-regulated protein
MILRTARHSIIWESLSGGTCLLLVITSLSGIPICRAETRAQAQPAQVSVDGEFKAQESRAAAPQDKKSAAKRAFEEAETLRIKYTVESCRDALVKYHEALALMVDIGDRKGEAHTLYGIAAVYRRLEENQNALKHYSLALLLSQSIEDRWLEAIVLSESGEMYSLLGENQKALEYFSLSLPISRALGMGWIEANLLCRMGEIYNLFGDSQKSLEHYNLSLSVSKAIGDRWLEAIVRGYIGLLYDSLGEYQQALEHHSVALSIFKALKNKRGEASALNNVGLVYDSLGAHQKALDYYNLALPLKREFKDQRGEAITLHNMGASYRSLEEHQKAIEHYSLALPLLRALGIKQVEAVTLNNLGFVYLALGKWQKALEHHNLSLSISQAVGSLRGQAFALKNIGSVYASSGDSQKALDYYHQSLRLSLDAKNHNLEAATRYLIARTYRSQNNLVEARSSIEAALEFVESLRTKITSPELRASYFASVQQYYDFYIDLLMRLDRLNPDQGYQEAALHASERARARILLEMLTEARVDIHQGVEPSLLERERSLRQSLDAKTEKQVKLLSRKHTRQEVELIEKEVEQLLAQYQEVKDQIKLKSPGYAALTQPSPLTLKEIQQEVVDADTLLLEYALGEEQSYLWAVTHDSTVTFQLPKRAEIEKAAQRVYDLLSLDGQQRRPAQFDSSYTEAVSALSRIVLGPAASQLGKKRLVIVAQGALSYIPFAALPLPAVQKPGIADVGQPADTQLLIANHEIIYLPSASALAALRQKLVGRKLAPKAVAVLADPVFNKDDVRVRTAAKGEAKAIDEKSGGQKDAPIIQSQEVSDSSLLRSAKEVGLGDGKELPRLPFSRREARDIFALSQQAGAMSALDFEASRKTATGAEIEQYRVVHFATHGLLNNEHPELSGLVLSLVDKQGESQNGFLRLYDIYNLRLGADLVVLSACQTALGKQIKGEGLVGVTRGFMYAGAARVVASLWRVDDKATAELMKKFYTGMMKDGQKPAAALRAAQLWMQKQNRWQSPYYWAGFILQGEWR